MMAATRKDSRILVGPGPARREAKLTSVTDESLPSSSELVLGSFVEVVAWRVGGAERGVIRRFSAIPEI